MYERVSQEGSGFKTFVFDFDHAPLQPLDLNGPAQKPQVDIPLDNTSPSISDSSATESSVGKPSMHDKAIPKDNESTLATLARGASHEWFSTLFDTCLSLIPLFFLVIAILCLCLNGRPISSYGENIKAITLLSPTIFPIVYAAIFGKVLRRIGLFKAERSSTIGTLEQLIGSQSFFASVERQFGLRRIDFLGIAIILAWLLSPLGGQSSLRLLSTRPSKAVVNVPIKYYAVEQFANDTLFGTHMEEYSWAQYAPLYMTALQTSRQTFNKPTDLFGNVRIPDLLSLNTTVQTDNLNSEWHDVAGSAEIKYASLLGTPIIDIPQAGNVSFTLESSYWQIRCAPFTRGAEYPVKPLNGSYYFDPYQGSIGPGPSGPSFGLQLYSENYTDVTVTGDRKEILTFHYLSKDSLTRAINSTCTAIFRLVESEVGCEAAACTVRKMRNSVRDMDPNISFMSKTSSMKLDSPYYTWPFLFQWLTQFMPGADLQPGDSKVTRRSEIVEQFIADPYVATKPDLAIDMHNGWVNLSTLSTEEFSSRLEMAVNTFWDASLGVEYRIGNLTTHDFGGREYKISAWNITDAIGERHIGEQYVCNIIFAALTIAISLFLFVAASVSVVLGFITRAPDILGYVSTLARDDPYFGKPIPSHLDGMEATRNLRDVRVIIGDVHKKKDVGHVAFASMEIEPERVHRKRLYD